MTKKSFIRLFIIWLFLPFSLKSQTNKPVPNLEIFQNLIKNSVEKVFQEISLDSLNGIIIRPRSAKADADWLVENELIKFCLDHNISVSMAAAPQSNDEFLLEFFVNNIGVSYTKIGNKKINRNCFVNIDFRTAKGKSLQFKDLKNFSRSFEDTVYVRDIARLEAKQYPFTQGKINQTKNWKKWINPTLVLLSTGVVIYSFFALRSK